MLDANPSNQISNIRKILKVYLHGQEVDRLGQYVLLKPFRVLVTLKVPSCRADSLIQYALPLWAGGGGVPGPGCGAGVGATGIMPEIFKTEGGMHRSHDFRFAALARAVIHDGHTGMNSMHEHL